MNEVVLNFIVSVVGIIIVIWTICNVINGYEEELEEKEGRRRK